MVVFSWLIIAPAVEHVILKNEPISAFMKQKMLMELRLYKGSYNALTIASKLKCRKQVKEPDLVIKAVNSWWSPTV